MIEASVVSVLSSGLRKVLEDGVCSMVGVCRRGRVGRRWGRWVWLRSGCRLIWVRGIGCCGVGCGRRSRQLGDAGGSIELLVAECAFEQWHRLLFARFLAENGLLIHPEFRAPVTLAECEELAGELGEPDGWAVAGRFAAEILPGIFRLDDPCVQLRLAPEGRLALEEIVAGLPAEVFAADDALGWVYQYWQKREEGRGQRVGTQDRWR